MSTDSLTITDRDIDSLADIFGFGFDAETREVIRRLDSFDVQACPGSGKTTALVAKLLLVARQLPLPMGEAICVLAHTNVAVDEIRRRAAESCRLFDTPNFCGTIQSFTDKYLAVPACAHYYGKRPIAIDANRHDMRLRREFWSLPPKARGAFKPVRDGSFGTQEDALAVWLGLRPALRDGKIIYTSGMGGKGYAVNPDSDRYRVIHTAREKILREGILHFDDAYFLAERYLRDFPALVNLFRLRFRYVFIDEMQDTYPHQMGILTTLFGSSVVMQRFGDQNQGIFSTGPVSWQPRDGFLPLSTSRRLPSNLAEKIRPVCHAPHPELGGHARSSIRPKVLLFDDSDISEVLPTFARVIRAEGLSDVLYPFKAVGRVGQNHNNPSVPTIRSYFPEFDKKPMKLSLSGTLHEFLNLGAAENASPYRDAILQAFLQVLHIAHRNQPNILRFSRAQLLRHLSSVHPEYYERLKGLLAAWCRDLRLGNNCHREVAGHIRKEFLPLFTTDYDETEPVLTAFLSPYKGSQNESNSIVSHAPRHTFVFGDTQEEITKIEIDTVHGVKGQTHTATLYLETYYNEVDIWPILGCLVDGSAPAPKSRAHGFLPVAYVAMSRPTDLLCIALHRKIGKYSANDEVKAKFDAAGWDVIEVRPAIHRAITTKAGN